MPKLRFPEFLNAGEWKLRELSELLTEPKAKNRQLKYGHEQVLSVSGEHGCVNQISLLGRSYAGASVKEYNVVETGDIVYTKSPLKACPNGIIKANKGPAGIVSVLYAVYRPIEAATSEFIDYYFSSHWNLNAYLEPLVKKGPKNSILVNNSDVLKGRIGVPEHDEQQKIADCLSSLGAVIAAEGERLAALRDNKKGLMQALFPALGQATPRIRFPEFRDAGEWATVNLSEVAFFQEGPGIMAVDFCDIGVPLIRLSGISGTSVTLDGCNYIDPMKVSDKWEHFCLDLDDLVISTSATFGLVASVTEEAAGAVFYTGLIRFRPRSGNLESSYLKTFLGSEPFARQVHSAAVGGGIKHFGPTHLKQMTMPLPSIAEQKLVADCLNAIDDLIAGAVQRLEALNVHKSGLTQQLFLSPAQVTA
ncbi:restriction endonuclease subunit S [Sphingomonas sp. PvP018]|uniref:restriction endonuclease subunit S n=1 Tax=Sphingomonas sp. PvP018 TaxID=2817852 RepID=UPI001AE1996E|nr:restriction endonuclease subunit S [Sphingomonas sp. PvP018]MBP2512657.1 type I restriction enzyme S subunit [Sphingomonas sp. PvP018]